jgi:hypothetical protein
METSDLFGAWLAGQILAPVIGIPLVLLILVIMAVIQAKNGQIERAKSGKRHG